MMYYTSKYKHLPLYGPLVILMVLPSNWLSLPPRPLPRPLPPPPPPRTPPPAPPPGPNSNNCDFIFFNTLTYVWYKW